MTILCTKEVVMMDDEFLETGTGDIAFTEGETYEVEVEGVHWVAVDNQSDDHHIGSPNDREWFDKHFKIIE